MTWVCRAASEKRHVCSPPFHVVGYVTVPDGSEGDLWRCDGCPTFWEIGLACARCSEGGDHFEVDVCEPGLTWRPASSYTHLLNWNRAVPSRSVFSPRILWLLVPVGLLLLAAVVILPWAVS